MPGYNVIRAQSLDSGGGVLATTTRSVTYAPQGTLTITVSGSGAVTRGYLGQTSQTLGTTIKVGEAPAPGYIFAGWTGTINSSKPVLSFPMQDGITEQASFIPNPFPLVSGKYFGLLMTGSGAQQGLVAVTLGAGGGFTGSVRWDGSVWGFAGVFDATGAATITIKRSKNTPLVITMQVDLTGGSGDITGSVVDGSNTYSFTASESAFNATNLAPQAGRYTLVIAPNANTTGSSVPQGDGYGVAVVNTSGVAAIAGRLGDGTPYSTTAHLAQDGSMAVYCVPSGSPARSSLTGLIAFQQTSVSDLSGTLTWTKAPRATDPTYPAGFSTVVPVVGSAYAKPSAGLQAMSVSATTSAVVCLGDGGLSQPLPPVPVTVNAADQVQMVTPGAPFVKLSINPVNGVVSGSFVLPGGNTVRGVSGVVLQKQQNAFGLFRGTDQFGYFSMVPGA
jgi:hypothetical protein